MAQPHQHLHKVAERAPAPLLTTQDGVVLSIVYVTAQPTFTGVIGGYTTLTDDSFDSQPSSTDDTSYFSAAPTSSVERSSAQSEPTSISQINLFTATNANTPSNAASSQSSFITTTNAYSSTRNIATATPSSSSTNDSSETTSSGGMTIGAKIGLAVAVIAGIGMIAAILLFCIGKKKRKQQAYSKADDEKTTFGASPAAMVMQPTPLPSVKPATPADAPRLSAIRPMSRMMPDFNTNSVNGSKTNVAEAGTSPVIGRGFVPSSRQPQQLSPPQPAHGAERQNPSNPFNDPTNPFADPEKGAMRPTQAPAPAAVHNMVTIPTQSSAPVSAPAATYVPSSVVAAGGATAVAAAALAHAKKSDPEKQEQPRSNSPPQSQLPVQDPIIVSAPAKSPSPIPEAPPGNVFRVLMDFKPSMDDELELLTGQLVRLLHEYDDGWALCIKLDRSQQGVVPRTCLATKPSRPKPSHLNQYAHGPSGRNSPMSPGYSPGGHSPGAMSPVGRPMSPANGPGYGMALMGRPMSPAGRPMSPGAHGPGRMHMIPPNGYNGPRPGMAQGPPRSPMSAQPISPGGSRPMSPGAFNQAPRPLSPGPRPQVVKRSMSPGPYGSGNGPQPMAGVDQRRRSNSAGALNVRRASPQPPSRLGPGNPPFRSQSPGIAY